MTESLQRLIAETRYVFFDFDGPICRLFAGHSAEDIARAQVKWLKDRGLFGLLTDRERNHPDPHGVLSAVARRHPKSDLVAELEERLTQKELEAVPTAWPTEFADPLIRTWVAVGARMAIVTNNSARTVTSYLESRGLLECFAPYIYGRSKNLELLKPHPHTLNRALNVLGAAPDATLMIGDAPSDCEAARSAGVSFLGYAGDPAVAKELLKAGAAPGHIVGSLEPVLRIVRGRA
ncbi:MULTISPECIES: HAD-IA family hydrolase [unclassified Streptomyces]|uniref:HAD family hydrolase n=1 Tax=unclassified Streptomyces TaxID=2593676 RepID=UPI0033EC946F